VSLLFLCSKRFCDIILNIDKNVIEPNFGAGFEGRYKHFWQWFIMKKEE